MNEALELRIVDDICLEEHFPQVTVSQREWFREHCVDWMKYLETTNKKWKRELNKDDPRDWAYMWITHWTKGFAYDPDQYISRHPPIYRREQ